MLSLVMIPAYELYIFKDMLTSTTTLVASSDHVARLWELAQGETIRQYNGHHKAAVCVALNDLSVGYA